MLKFIRFLKNYKKEVILGPLFKLFEAIFEIIVPLVMAKIIDVGIRNNDKTYIMQMCGVIILLGVCGLIFALIAQYYAARCGIGFGTELRRALYKHINSLSYAEVDKFGTSSLITRMINDTTTAQTGVNMVIRLAVRAPFLVIGSTIMAMILDIKRYSLNVKKLTRDEVFKQGYGQKIFSIINDTFKDLYGYSELSQKQIDHYVKMYLPMADLNLITLVEDWNADKKVVGVGITIPSLSRAFQKCRNGRLFPFGWWHVLRALKYQKTEGVDLLLMGILPEYRAKGANALMFADLIPWYQKYGYKWGESQVEMESNDNVQSQWGPLKPENHKRRRCYVKLIRD